MLSLVFAATAKSGLFVSKPTTKINTETPVSVSNCMPCHGGLTRTKFENLNFSHEKHFKKGIRCESCHQEFPHNKKEIISKPKMEWCFNCHGLSHGKQGLKATGRCNACHSDNFNLTPKDHTVNWRDSGHKSVKDINNCAMCHKSESCNKCHEKRNIEKMKLGKFRPSATIKSKGQIIDFKGKVTASKCTPCHGTFARQKFKTLNFKHEVHFKRNISCDKCHREFPHYKNDGISPLTKIPDMRTCFSCHGLSHSNQGTFAPGKCSTCHPADFKLKPKTHDNKWVKEPPFNHKVQAKNDRGECMMCHDQQQFCNKCHGLEPIPHEKSWKDLHGKNVVELAANSTPSSYASLACNKCHSQQKFCSKCHKGVGFPHSQDWASQHGKTAADKGKNACYTCHTKQLCNGCHGNVQMPHANDWLGQHKNWFDDVSKTVKDCIGCHKKEQCEQCHSTHRVHNRNKIFNYDNFPGLSR